MNAQFNPECDREDGIKLTWNRDTFEWRSFARGANPQAAYQALSAVPPVRDPKAAARRRAAAPTAILQCGTCQPV